jgi:hypothetical protein
MTGRKWSGFGMALLFVILLFSFANPASAAGSVTAGSVNGTSGSTSLVPLTLAGADPMFRLDLTLSYDPTVCTAVDVLPGDFTSNTTLTRALDRGEVRLALESSDGIGGDGVLAWIRFRILASKGSTKIRILSARSTTPLEKIDGALSIIPGITFSRTTGGRQRVSVDLQGSRASITGNEITFSQGGMQIFLRTEGIGSTATFASGLVHNVTMTSPPATVLLPAGTAKGAFALTFPEYPSEGTLLLVLFPTPSPGFQEVLDRTAAASNLNITAVLLTANSSVHGVSASPPVNFTFILPSGLAPASTETYRLATRKGDNPVSLLVPSYFDAGDGTLQITATFSRVPAELALLTVKEGVPPASPIAPYTAGSILSPGAESAGGNIWVGMLLMFFLVAMVVVAVLYVHRKRGG